MHSARPYILAVVLPLAGGLLLTGCQGEETSTDDRRPIGQASAPGEQGDRPSARQEMSAGVAAQLDSGNAAYRMEEYERARTHYRRALDQEEDSNAAWFGIYMAENALGNEAAADSALERAGSLSGSEAMHPAPGDSASDGAGPMHPPISGAEDDAPDQDGGG